MLKKKFPQIKAVVSYADQNQGHRGAIYEASNWIFVGEAAKQPVWLLGGKKLHDRTISGGGFSGGKSMKKFAIPVEQLPKRKFLWVFDKDLRAKYRER